MADGVWHAPPDFLIDITNSNSFKRKFRFSQTNIYSQVILFCVLLKSYDSVALSP